MSKLWVKTPRWIMDDPLLTKVYCMGFLSGFGKSKEWNHDIKEMKKARMKSGRKCHAQTGKTKGLVGYKYDPKYVSVARRGLNIHSCARENISHSSKDTKGDKK